MAVDPRILQQYIDTYNQKQNVYGRQVEGFNTAVNTYNQGVESYNKNTKPRIDSLVNSYNYELNHLQGDVQRYNDNLWASNRGDWDNALRSWQDYHYGQANNYNNQISNLERTLPMAPSAAAGLFNERLYLEQNPDVASAVRAGQFKSGMDHYVQYGRNEGRNAATGGVKAESQLKAAADWQAQAQSAFNNYMNALNAARSRSSSTDSVFNGAAANNAIQARTNEAERLKLEYQKLLDQRPEMAEFSERQPSFTQEQINALTGNVGLGKQMLQQEGGLIGGELASAANERNSDSMIAGILSKARGRG